MLKELFLCHPFTLVKVLLGRATFLVLLISSSLENFDGVGATVDFLLSLDFGAELIGFLALLFVERVYRFLVDLQVTLQVLSQFDVRSRELECFVLHLVNLLAHLNEVT